MQTPHGLSITPATVIRVAGHVIADIMPETMYRDKQKKFPIFHYISEKQIKLLLLQ